MPQPSLTRRSLFTLSAGAVAALALPAMPAQAFDASSPSPLNLDGGLAIKGYDPVAYVAQNAAMLGKPALTARHAGAIYRFSSEANRDAFTADPARYAPVYGGFCAFGASYGSKIDIDPEAFGVVDGRLYLNVSKRINRRWSRDADALIEAADANWPRIKNVAPSQL